MKLSVLTASFFLLSMTAHAEQSMYLNCEAEISGETVSMSYTPEHQDIFNPDGNAITAVRIGNYISYRRGRQEVEIMKPFFDIDATYPRVFGVATSYKGKKTIFTTLRLNYDFSGDEERATKFTLSFPKKVLEEIRNSEEPGVDFKGKISVQKSVAEFEGEQTEYASLGTFTAECYGTRAQRP